MGSTLTVKPDAFYTDGVRLLQVLSVDEEGVWAEDAATLDLVQLSHTDFAAGSWREVSHDPEVDDG